MNLTKTHVALALLFALGCGDDDGVPLDAAGDDGRALAEDTGPDGDGGDLVDAAYVDAPDSSDEPDAAPSTGIVLGELKAFPTAHGYGAYASGGRGGRIIEVSDYESLREAVYAEGPRIVVFSRSGYIQGPGGYITTRNPDITVLGQTAPDPGVTLRTLALTISHSNVVLRHFAIRPGEVVGELRTDCARIRTEAESIDNVMFDHLSVSWSDDENMSMGATGGVDGEDTLTNVTVQHCLSAEPTGAPYHFLIGRRVHGLSIIRNLYAHGSNRIPENTYGGGERYEFSNNLIYNYGRATTVATVCMADVFGNGFKAGTNAPDRQHNITFGRNGVENPDAELSASTLAGGDNIQIGDADGQVMYNDRWNDQVGGSRALDDATYVAFPAAELEARVLNNVGHGRDDVVDARILADYRAGTGRRNLNSEDQVGGFPELVEQTHPDGYDDNENYVADAFEVEHGITDVNDKPEFFTIGTLRFDNRVYSGGTYIGADGHTVNEYQGGAVATSRLYTWREIFWASLAGDFAPAVWE